MLKKKIAALMLGTAVAATGIGAACGIGFAGEEKAAVFYGATESREESKAYVDDMLMELFG